MWSLGSIYTHPIRLCGGPNSAGTLKRHPPTRARGRATQNCCDFSGYPRLIRQSGARTQFRKQELLYKCLSRNDSLFCCHCAGTIKCLERLCFKRMSWKLVAC